jgi:hypothetical protein
VLSESLSKSAGKEKSWPPRPDVSVDIAGISKMFLVLKLLIVLNQVLR